VGTFSLFKLNLNYVFVGLLIYSFAACFSRAPFFTSRQSFYGLLVHYFVVFPFPANHPGVFCLASTPFFFFLFFGVPSFLFSFSLAIRTHFDFSPYFFGPLYSSGLTGLLSFEDSVANLVP